ncbi:hypothetical protein ACHAXS_002030 [Conticribra weissflogii]
MILIQPGLILQMIGFLTSDQIWVITIFVNHATTKAFKKLALQGGNTIKLYHADNGRYVDKGFMEALDADNQTITFCAAGAQHQIGIIERQIEVVTEVVCTLLIHVQRHWLECVDTMVWTLLSKQQSND